MKRCLLVYAHADDELLWGHPWLLDRMLDRKVLICCSDRTNPARQEYRRGEEALDAVCSAVGVAEHRVLSNYHSEFYKLRTRGAGSGPLLKDWWRDAQSAIREMSADCDFIVTHNPWGEYGHMDHLLVRRAVMETSGLPPAHWTTARVVTTTWPLGDSMSHGGIVEAQQPAPRASLFAELKQHYVSRECWTWSSDEPMLVDLVSERPPHDDR